MPSAEYNLIKGIINNTTQSLAISAMYGSDPSPRMLWPHVLGMSEIPDSNPPQQQEMVLCYHYGGYTPYPLATPHRDRKNFRCLKVASLKNVQSIPFIAAPPPPPPTGQTWKPWKFKPKQVKRQNCVETVDVYR